MSIESTENTIDLIAVIAIILLLFYGVQSVSKSIGDALANLFPSLKGDPVAKIDPSTGLPIDPATGKADTGFPGLHAPTDSQAAGIRATFETGTPLDSIDTTQMEGFTA